MLVDTTNIHFVCCREELRDASCFCLHRMRLRLLFIYLFICVRGVQYRFPESERDEGFFLNTSYHITPYHLVHSIESDLFRYDSESFCWKINSIQLRKIGSSPQLDRCLLM